MLAEHLCHWVGAGLQVLGLFLTLLGLVVVRDWLAQQRDSATKAVTGARTWAQRKRQEFAAWRARRRKGPAMITDMGAASASLSTSAKITTTRIRVDRDAVGDREWLEYLDTHLEEAFRRISQAEALANAHADTQAAALARLRDEIHRELETVQRTGWGLVFSGLLISMLGTSLSAFG